MAGDKEMVGWTELLQSSTKLSGEATGSQFPPLHRGIDELESLSKKLRTRISRPEAEAKSIPATRLLAREGLNAERLASDLKSFELKTTYEDVFPSNASTVEDYLQQVHEMAMVSAIQEAQRDNLRSFNDHMMRTLEDDWQKEKRDSLQSLNRLSTLPRTNSSFLRSGVAGTSQITSPTSIPQVSTSPFPVELMPPADKSAVEKKAPVYAEVVGNLNIARGSGLPFKPATALASAYGSLNLETSRGKSVTMQKIWHLIQQLAGEENSTQRNISGKMSLVTGAKRHLEWGHEKHIIDTIQSHPVQAALGGSIENLQRVRSYLRVRLKEHGVLDFDAGDTCRQPPVDTSWQQIYFCLRTGYYDEATRVAESSRAAHNFAPQLVEWINTGGMVSPETTIAASEECDRLLRIGDQAGRLGYDQKKLLLYAIISGCRHQIDRLLRDLPTFCSTIEDFLWFILSSVRDYPAGSSPLVQSEGLVPYTLEDLHGYLNKFEPSYYTKNGKDPLVYPYVLFLSIQLLPAVLYLSKIGGQGYDIDAVHISIVLADHGVLEGGAGSSNKIGLMDACAEAASIIKHYGSLYLRNGNLLLALQYFVQAAAAMGGGEVSWSGRGSVDKQRQRVLMLNQLLTEILLRDGGVALLLGSIGAGEEGLLRKYLTDLRSREEFLLKAAHQCQESGLYDKSVEIHTKVGAFAMALDTINKCLSDAICAMLRGRLDSESRAAGLIHSGNDILDTFRYSSEKSIQGREQISEQQIVLRQLEAILHVHKLTREEQYVDALREITKLSFLPLNPHAADDTASVLQNLSPYVQACVPELLKATLCCMDHVTDTDGILRRLKAKIATLVANNINRNWPSDLVEKVTLSI